MTNPDRITSVDGVRVGHWTDAVGGTGCSVVLFPAGTIASGEVRGGAPGTREWALLAPDKMVTQLDAVALCGGSAPGLAACDGVSRWCEERGLGWPTAFGPVPIVVGAVLFDRGVGDPMARPAAEHGYAACVAARDGEFATGLVGAGAGATIDKWRGPAQVRAGGIGTSSESAGLLVVGALIAVNAWGSVRPADGATLDLAPLQAMAGAGGVENTTIGVVATNARLDKRECLLVAQSGHDGLARALEPVHAVFDGDALVAAATGEVSAPLETVRALAARAVERAVRQAVAHAGQPGRPAGRLEAPG